MKKVTHILALIGTTLILTVCAVLIPTLGIAEETTHLLEGSSYVVEVQKSGEQLFSNENLEFADGKFETTFLEGQGFERAEYTSTRDEGAIKWRVVSKNKGGDSLVWEGTQSEGKIQGTITKTTGKDSGTTWSFKSAPRD